MDAIDVRISKRVYRKILGGKQVFTPYEIRPIDAKAGTLLRLRYGSKFVAWATVNPKSRNYVRILSFDKNYDVLEDFVQKLRKAKKYREKISYGKHYRWVYSESDFLSGLILDKYDTLVVIQNQNPFYDNHMKELVEAIREVDKSVEAIYRKDSGRNRLNDGLLPIEEPLYGDSFEVIIEELDRKFLVDPTQGQKTGFFLDQRENRKLFRKLSYGRVLDVFSYTGGFGITSNFDEVYFVEKDKSALHLLKKNLELNEISNYKILKGNAFTILKHLILKREKFDSIVLDPPAFLAVGDKKQGVKSYALINSLAAELIDEGIFVTCSCSQDMKIGKFYNLIKTVLRRKGKRFEIIAIGRQALDHKVVFPHKELDYLKCLFLEIF